MAGLLSMNPVWLLLVYCLLILLASLAGGWVPMIFRLTHTRLQLGASFIAGLMLGVGCLHLLPHAWLELGSVHQCMAWMLTGFLLTFFVQRFLPHHHHDISDNAGDHGGHRHAPPHPVALPPPEMSAGRWAWIGAAFGLAIHTVINGMVLAASIQAGADRDALWGMVGLGTFLVIFLHKPFDSLTISALMTTGGWSRSARHTVNGLYALGIPVGVVLFYAGLVYGPGSGQEFLGIALAYAAGTFFCIAAIDLLPELQFHKHDRFKLSAALLMGLGVAFLVGFFEGNSHTHDHRPVRQERHLHPLGAVPFAGDVRSGTSISDPSRARVRLREAPVRKHRVP